jgi:hypothetical protein
MSDERRKRFSGRKHREQATIKTGTAKNSMRLVKLLRQRRIPESAASQTPRRRRGKAAVK